MRNHAKYAIVEDSFTCDSPLVIRDVGPWDYHKTITNDAEWVVAELFRLGLLAPAQRLLYYDSEGDLAEIVIANGGFFGFRPAPAPQAGG